MISRKTLLQTVAGFFVSGKVLKERGFKFFKLLVALLFQPTYKLIKQLVSLYFDYFSCCQRITSPPHLTVT